MRSIFILLGCFSCFVSCQKDPIQENPDKSIPLLYRWMSPDVANLADASTDDYLAIVQIVNGKKGGWTGPDFPRMYIALTDSAFHVLSGGKLEINAQDFTIGPNLVSAFDEPLLHNIYGDSATFKFVDRFNTVISEVNFYIPDQLNVGFFENFPDLSHSGGQISWNRDLLNPYGVLITSLYDPAGNPTLATSYPEKINGYEHVGSDQGSFTYSSSDVSAFPVNSRLILHCIRGNYAVDSTSFGKVLYLCYSKTGGFVDLQ